MKDCTFDAFMECVNPRDTSWYIGVTQAWVAEREKQGDKLVKTRPSRYTPAQVEEDRKRWGRSVTDL